jgi:predicted metal-dependent phosphotriesterase family hydrolase
MRWCGCARFLWREALMSAAINSSVRTVLGDVDEATLGRMNYHEHLFQVTPLLPGDELDDEASSTAEAALLRQSGFDSMIDATPIGLARDPLALARISSSLGLGVVATTGAHHSGHYPESHWIRQADERRLAEWFRADIEYGMPAADDADRVAGRAAEPAVHQGRPIRAGIAKAGIGYWSIPAFERRVLAAVAATHRATGCPVMVHLEAGSATFEVLDILARDGVPASAVVLAHIDRNPDPVLHADLAAAGAYLGYDGFARSRNWPDSVLLDCALDAIERGAGERIVIGGDVARRQRYIAYGGMPGLEYVGRRVVPQLIERAGVALANRILIENPARLLARFGAV